MEVVQQESPGVDRERPGADPARDSAHEILPVLLIVEDNLAMQPPGHHVIKDPGGIEARAARRGRRERMTRLIRLPRPALQKVFQMKFGVSPESVAVA